MARAKGAKKEVPISTEAQRVSAREGAASTYGKITEEGLDRMGPREELGLHGESEARRLTRNYPQGGVFRGPPPYRSSPPPSGGLTHGASIPEGNNPAVKFAGRSNC